MQNLPSGLEISRKKQWDDHKTTMAGVLGWPCECTIRYYPPKMEPENRHFLATWQGPTVGRMVTGCDWVTGMVQSIGKFVGPLMLLYVPSIASDPRVTLVLDLVNISQSQNGEG